MSSHTSMDTSKPRILTAENIYPGIDPITRRPNSVNAHTFVEVFSEIINWLKSRDLEKYIQDPEGKLIQPKDKQQKLLKDLEESTLNEFYNSIRARKWNSYYDLYVNDWTNKIISMHRSLSIEIPPETIETFVGSKQKLCKEFNKSLLKGAPEKKGLPYRVLLVSDKDVREQIELEFCTTFNQWALPVTLPNGTVCPITSEVKKKRLDLVGELENLYTRIEDKRKSLMKQSQDHTDAIQNLRKFFGTIVSYLPPSVNPLVENHEFTKAWNAVLKYNLVDLDTTFLTITLQKKILNLQYDPSIDSNFLTFCDRFNMTHSLHLFHQWYAYLSFDSIRRIVDDMTDEEFITEFSSTITQHNLTLPELANTKNKILQLKNAVVKTHLSETLRTTLQINSNGSFQQLKEHLYQADNAYDGKKYNNSNPNAGSLCTMCNTLVQYNIINQSHTSDNPCPAKAAKALDKYLETTNSRLRNLARISDSNSSNTTSSTISSSSNHYGLTSTYQHSEPTKIGNSSQAPIKHERKALVPLPTWFNEQTQCGNCYRSSLTTGADSVERGEQYNNHSTQACHWRNIKRKRRLEYQNQQRSYQANTAIKDPPESVVCSLNDPGYASDDTYRSTTSRKSRRRGNSVASDD